VKYRLLFHVSTFSPSSVLKCKLDPDENESLPSLAFEGKMMEKSKNNPKKRGSSRARPVKSLIKTFESAYFSCGLTYSDAARVKISHLCSRRSNHVR